MRMHVAADALGEVGRVTEPAIGEHNDEFFTPPANHRVLTPHRSLQDPGDVDENAVPGEVPEVIINPLEVVDIRNDQAK
ncbi:hypothetical protein D3C72_2331590 [compost metagenome]